ncbi:CPBP family intramembrane glutamic endopeptidase [Thermobispora bispora]|uniref:Abortive infection protein n=1 Tax=Thermobispora bispora (strain ATCC 19993 / DSM 43833 / CBS 139.67 / JCM 10125 / KCTC 9307 / NBRC 14880 / R51) TaxID=469371 RepID=D6Y908_THEBD|nr:CPBP family intramembrane glutamic endopeptidase [Thermobispora bispora]MBO2474905.1 CPBP family intramembrane metalloprotease [Actinomycetales bacterium]MDI9579114.1 CPBP family intramembrane metalloprotease [Thermobispora sp.]ADG89970.1 Abortive infection protein [Thermobispora bispora DSM 43833]QSI46431.1 CPBP family intramembrane metalloprotease [Thermobispora bispora]QSI49537.1 CPBP family intramembrane metalloprotease [Thermobispora bispora]
MVALVLAAALVGYLTVITPLLGKHTYDRLARTRDRDPDALGRTYRLWITETWAIAAVALITAHLAGLGPEQIGLSLGSDPAYTAALLGGMVLAVAGVAVAQRRGLRLPAPAPGASALLPRTAKERRQAIALSITAGVCEELIFRGVLIGLGAHVLGLPLPVAAGLSLAVFVFGHLYQGWKSMLVVALLGLVLTFAYLRTGGLLLPIAMHILIDVRGLVLSPADGPREAAAVRG